MPLPGLRGRSRDRRLGSNFGRGREWGFGASRGGRDAKERGVGGGDGSGPFRGRGPSRGRGRGKPIYDSQRLIQKQEAEEAEESESDVPSGEEEASESESSDEGEEPLPSVQPYVSLMQSFAIISVPQAKRRKLHHVSEPKPSKTKDQVDTENSVANVDDTDKVDESEEGPETTTDDILEDKDDTEDSSDPFEAHFAAPDDNILARRFKALDLSEWTTQKVALPKLGKAVFSLPDKELFGPFVPTIVADPSELKLKNKLANFMVKARPKFDILEGSIAPLMFNYQDVLYCERSITNSENLRRLACLHALNHVFKTRDRVIKNNARLTKEEDNSDIDLRDQGFTRPKVLMILPTRESCARMVSMIISICEPEQQENQKRFNDSYVETEEKFSTEKPEDFRELFRGNDDDMFRLGLKFTRKTVKYFSQFYNSDIIFASPLGLRMALEGKEDQNGDYDFLSSIEMVVVDQADALLMQNWEHVEYIFEHLNLQPKEAHGCDFSRVRSWYLDNKAKNFRQTIALAAFNTPELNNLFFNQSKNWSGKVKIINKYTGVIQDLGLKTRQTFSRLESPSFAAEPDARFAYFTTAIIPALTRRSKDTAGTVIFIPSYLDFVRVRNYFSTSTATSDLSFGNISEYTSVQDVARARSHFFHGRHSVLLYTERAHHFRRYQLRGVKKVIMYGLPDNPIFYQEIVGGYLGKSIQDGKLEQGGGSVRALFSKWDALKLERVVGTDRVGKMILEKGDTFDFL
ncbi:unnamed protein product [Diplocarpon coronariae]